MKDRRRKEVFSWSSFFWCTIFIVFSSVLFTGFSFSAFRLFNGESFISVLTPTWRSYAIEAISGDLPAVTTAVTIRETVIFPDQALLFLKYPPYFPLLAKEDLDCIFYAPNSSVPNHNLPPIRIDGEDADSQMVRCTAPPRGFTVSIEMKSKGQYLSPSVPHRWDYVAYEALIDTDNTTIVFVKGLNLRPEKISDPSSFECVYGWDLTRPKLVLRSDVVHAAQEIVRCKTPLVVLTGAVDAASNDSIRVSVRTKGRGTLSSMARPERKFVPEHQSNGKEHEMCVCTMLRNQARFLREWVVYHSRIGVQKWFIYDNNSEDDIGEVLEVLQNENYNISRCLWPWIKTQEAGFAHCALRARVSCKWVGFIDVDEFFHLPSGLELHDVLKNKSMSSKVGEIRTSCHNFGPSGLNRAPVKGVTVGYTCRLHATERHKSIVNPEALNSTLVNVIHHFHLKDGFDSVSMDPATMVINHYKYQVWGVFKEKFYRRVATYVADWQQEQNAGSKDRAPGLGTRPVEPSNWAGRFCEVVDTGLRDRVVGAFVDPLTGLLPWQVRIEGEQVDREFTILDEGRRKKTRVKEGKRRKVKRKAGL